MIRRAPTALAAIAVAAVAGCGLGPGPGTSDVTLTVTQRFGTAHVATATEKQVPGSETVMRMLERRFHVQTKYGGGFVESIDGLSGVPPRRDWFYYVNGVQAPAGAASTAVHKGDHIWWDLHDWTATNTIPAVVGSFPEPFVHGIDGKRYPTTLECAADVPAACKLVGAALKAAGIPYASQYIGTGSGPDTLGVVVGTWSDLRAEVAAGLIDHGPSASGVYAHFSGGALQLLDAGGHAAKTLTGSTGLVAATADSQSSPTWFVTGSDAKGVTAAAAAVTPGRLDGHFAVAVLGGTDYPVPVP
jgi:hypothetical protein